jgi:hypothetical protein
LIAAIHSATAVFRAYVLLWDRQNRLDRFELEREIEQRWQARGAGPRSRRTEVRYKV